jgi:hypothetical protein
LAKLKSCPTNPTKSANDPFGVGLGQEDAAFQQRVRLLLRFDTQDPFGRFGYDADAETFEKTIEDEKILILISKTLGLAQANDIETT